MWLHAPRPPDAPAEPPALLAPEFSLWLLASGKPELVRSSEIDWPKCGWLRELDLWETPAAQAARVRYHLERVDDAGARVLAGPRVLGLCAGYGGLERAIALAHDGRARAIGYVERQAYAAAVLTARMKEGALHEAPIWDDLETFDCAPWRGLVDLVAGGIPCQGASVAGKRKGVDDERWLWPVFWRIVQEVGAPAFFLENVPGILSVNGGRAFESILGDLVARGWIAEWDCVPAAAVGAPHLRDRFSLLAADPDRIGVRVEPERDQRRGRRARAAERGAPEPVGGGADGDADVAADADRAPGESHRGSERTEPRDAQGAGGADPDAARLGRDEGPEIDAVAQRRRGADAGRGDQHGAGADPDADHEPERAEHGEQSDPRPDGAARGGAADRPGAGAPADAAGVERAASGRAEQLEVGPDAERGGGRGADDAPDAGGAGSQGRGSAEPATDRDRGAGGAGAAAHPNGRGCEGIRGRGELDEGERAQRGRDVDGCRGAEDRHGDALGGAVRDQLDRLVELGRADWEWGRAPLATIRSLAHGSANWLDGDLGAADDQDGRSEESVPCVPRAVRSAPVRRANGRSGAVSVQGVLFQGVHGTAPGDHEPATEAPGEPEASAQVEAGRVRTVRRDREVVYPPQGSRLVEQLPGQLADALRVLSHDLASRGWRHRLGAPEEEMPALRRALQETQSLRASLAADESAWRSATDDEKHRWLVETRDRLEQHWIMDAHADQLHLLGNGVVPLQAAYAFVILWSRLVGDAP